MYGPVIFVLRPTRMLYVLLTPWQQVSQFTNK